MKRRTISITASVVTINALGEILVPFSTQKILSESIYLKAFKETIDICLS